MLRVPDNAEMRYGILIDTRDIEVDSDEFAVKDNVSTPTPYVGFGKMRADCEDHICLLKKIQYRGMKQICAETQWMIL